MRYPLLSRFQATWQGAALGEIYGFQSQQRKLSQVGTYHPSAWSQIAVLGAESLLKLGKFDLAAWQELSSNFQLDPKDSNKAIIATIPVALIFHEDLDKQGQNLQQLVAIWHNDPVVIEGALAIGYAIALSLREKLDPVSLIPQILTYLGSSQSLLGRYLERVQTLLDQKTSLSQTVNHFSQDISPVHLPIILAFYCFLSTPEDFRLSVSRATRFNSHPDITGILSAAYNSLIGIPVIGQLEISKYNWGSRSSKQVLQLGERLFALWSGVYDHSQPDQLPLSSAIAAPYVMQPR